MQNTMQSNQPTFSDVGIIWLKLAVVYLILGVAMGIVMGASENFTLRPVHAHVNLLGWATMALAGLIYSIFPKAGRSKLATLHFWLSNLSLPVMTVALALLLTGSHQVVPILAVSEMVAAIGVACFAANLFINLKKV